MVPGESDRTHEIVEHLFALVDRLRSGFEQAVSRFDLSPPQAKALRYLAHAGPVPMRELACGLHCDASNVTGIVDRLEQRGLVQRTPSPDDRRVKSLVITVAGASLAEQVWAHLMEGGSFTAWLTESQQATLLELLRSLDHGPGAACWVSTEVGDAASHGGR